MTSKASLHKKFWPTAFVLPGPAKRALLVTTNPCTKRLSKKRSKVKETRAVIIDIGTGSCKIGYAGEPKPSFVVSSTVGETCKTGDNLSSNISQKLVNSLRHGIIVDWDCIEAVLENLYIKEMISPDEHAVLLSDPPLSPITNREKYTEMMFETFNIPAFHIAYQSRLSMYSYGKTSGLVVECGHGASYVVPIIEGNVLPSLTNRADYAGADITKYLMLRLNETGHTFKEEHLDVIQDIKETSCYVSSDWNEELCLPQNKYVTEYKLPDGQQITIGKERFLCPEALFQPSLIDSPQAGLPAMTMTCINNCDTDFHKSMLNNILLCGGTTMLKGFHERFQKELNKFPCHQQPCILACPERQFSAWRGGSVLASLNSFQQHWLYKKEYEEHGPSVIYRQCL